MFSLTFMTRFFLAQTYLKSDNENSYEREGNDHEIEF
jgi:hypothetical protein